MVSRDALEAVARLAEIAFVGRVILSLCPPGLPGRHGPRDLFATWGASHLLGGIALAAESAAADLLGLELSPLALVAPWLLPAFLRWITLPGAMVPRHEPVAEDSGALARVLAVAAPLAVALAAGRGGIVELAPAADAIALLACVSFALAAARRAPVARALFVLALALGLALGLAHAEDPSIALALHTGGGAAFAAVWLRRGDRRAVALAAFAFAGCALLGAREALFGAAGLFALWLHTPAPSQRRVLLLSLVALAPATALGWSRYDPFAAEPPVVSRLTGAVLVVAALALWRRKGLVDARAAAKGSAADAVDATGIRSPRAEAQAVRDAVLLSALPLAARSELSSLASLAPALLPLAPLVLLDLGLALAPPEMPLAAAAPEPEGRR